VTFSEALDPEDNPKNSHPRTNREYASLAKTLSDRLVGDAERNLNVRIVRGPDTEDADAARNLNVKVVTGIPSFFDEVCSCPPFEEEHPAAKKMRDSLGKFEDDSERIFEELCDVLCTKQVDYGPDNINNAPGGAMNGILVRMSDKMERLKNLTYHSEGEPNHESVDDSLLDIANYAVIALMVRRGVWPKSYGA